LKCEHLGIVLVVYSGMLQQYTSAENTGWNSLVKLFQRCTLFLFF
jgi:hypothetical protein